MDHPRTSTPMPCRCMIRISARCGPNCACCREYRRFMENHREPKNLRKVYRVKGVEKTACCDIVAGHVLFKCSRKFLSLKDFLAKLRRKFWRKNKTLRMSRDIVDSVL
ncbi:hypothetical protein Zmor_012906 [Zophobas morio]|uniref:Uncharacterized protein n=1 Tax=Zophobas morio TaxID=2755281 RepID=A0AA38IGT8_9CUCU|nr:hypothetical protein Zmor_012906 [Zophobas morio]